MAPLGGCAERGMVQGYLQKGRTLQKLNNETVANETGGEEKESLGQGEGWKRKSMFKLTEKLPLTSPGWLITVTWESIGEGKWYCH